jgi:single-stranded DNA-binding protein
MTLTNRVVLKGDITSDIYYDIFTIGGKPSPYLRVYLMVNATDETREVKGLRVVFYGSKAEEAEAHLMKGSRIQIEGHIQMRRAPNGNPTFEIVVEDAEYVRNIDWERGARKKEQMLAEGRIPSRKNLSVPVIDVSEVENQGSNQ